MRRMYSQNELKKLIQESPEQVVEALNGQDISPKDISASGSISGDEIVENMSGYSFEYDTPTGYTFENVYVGAVKTGNKLTLVCAFNITRTEDSLTGGLLIGRFGIPESVGSKLFPTTIGSYDYLYNGDFLFWSSGWAKKNQVGYLRKVNDTQLNLNMDDGIHANLVKDTKYYCRIEMTFLLSGNLVQSE